MYESTFDFAERPFAAAPLTDRFYPAGAIEHARQTLARAIERAEGPGLLIGPAGTGKTLVCHLLAEQFHEQFHVAMLASARLCTRRALLQNILFELRLPYRDMEEGELRLTLIDHLEPSETCPRGMLLLVDEAHTLPMRLLEEIRMITNLVRDGQPRVRLVLAGSPLLEERFASPKLESFSQRIKARCYLQPMSRDETREYVRSQVHSAGGAPGRVFADDSYRAVFNATDGIPRLINQVCDHALVLSAGGGRKKIDAAAIEEAWADLQQLPTPWQEPAKPNAAASSVIEFGELSDDGLHAALLSDTQDDADVVHLPRLVVPDEQFADADSTLPIESDEPRITAGAIGPHVELVYRGPHNPFDEPFAEEEVVIDRYATLEAGAFRDRPKVSSIEGQEIAAALRSFVSHQPAPSNTIPLTIAKVTHEMKATAPAKQAAAVAVETVTEESATEAMDDDDWDDRDLIVVEEDAVRVDSAVVTTGKARRQEYRQLFSRLRRG
jgi:type II secretory pathway predicted ATPase ExeA